MAPPTPFMILNDGNRIPILAYGFGGARYVYKSDRKTIIRDTVTAGLLAIKTGFVHLDVAELWGNEREVGEAIKKSGISRERLYVTTKFASTPPLDIIKSLERSLEYLGLDYVDQYLLHEPFWANGSDEQLQRAWSVMEWLRGTGRVRSIGVSNFSQKQLEAILQTARIIPAINQVEFHPYLQHRELQMFQMKRGIVMSGYSTLNAITKASPGPVDDIYAALARKYGVTPGDIALRWVIDQGIVAITTSANVDRMKGCMEITNFNLTYDEIEEIRIKGLEKSFRGSWTHKFEPDDLN